MKLVINGNYGGYGVPKEVMDALGCDYWDDSEKVRSSDEFVDWVRQHKDETDLVVVDIPDSATDYQIDEYDGWENVIYVLYGRIYPAAPEVILEG